MKALLIFSGFLFLSVFSFGQKEYTTYSLGEKKFEIGIDASLIASMKAGTDVMLSASDGKGHTLTILVADKVAISEVNGGYKAPMLTITLPSGEIKKMESGSIEIKTIKEKNYTGTFKGKTGSEDLQGSFSITLDL